MRMNIDYSEEVVDEFIKSLEAVIKGVKEKRIHIESCTEEKRFIGKYSVIDVNFSFNFIE